MVFGHCSTCVTSVCCLMFSVRPVAQLGRVNASDLTSAAGQPLAVLCGVLCPPPAGNTVHGSAAYSWTTPRWTKHIQFFLSATFFYHGGGTFAWLRIEKMCKGRGGAVHCLKYSLKFQRLNILITKMYTHIWHFTYPFSLYAIPCVGTQVVCAKKRRTCFNHLGVINLCVILGHHYVNVYKSSTFFHSFLHFYLKSSKYL